MEPMPFASLAQLGEQLEQTTKRGELVTLLAEFLRKLAPEEIPPAVRLTIGQVFPEWDGRALNISWRALMAVVDTLTDASPEMRDRAFSEAIDGGEAVRLLLERARKTGPRTPALSILEVYDAFERIAATSGRGSRARKEGLLQGLLQRSSPIEAKYLTKIISQEMRHGVSEGLMIEGIARAAGVRSRQVRRANQLWGDVGEVALVALAEGEAGLAAASIRLFRPVKPMLAQTAQQISEAFERYEGQFALEYKLDGARVQIHRQGNTVRIYTRNLAEVTASLPDVVEKVQGGLDAQEAILDGEALAIDAEGRPLPFQHLMRRFRRKHDLEAAIKEVPVELYLFDILFANGESLVDSAYADRWAALEKAAGDLRLVERLLPVTEAQGVAFAEAARLDGHEGVMAKDLASTYDPGGRGKSWLKLKHVMSLDLVIVAADWGYGRRHGWLSNYHLAVLDADTREFRTVGKTFKGLTDAEFQGMTERLLDLELSRQRSTVRVQPQVVVEVLFNEIQASSQYPSGFALRFARISRIREDKHPSEADSLQSLRQLYEEQFQYKGRYT